MQESCVGNQLYTVDFPVRLTMAELQRLSLVAAKISRSSAQTARASGDVDDELMAIAEARRLRRIRRAREVQFGSTLFSDPAWDMLLDLFIAEGQPRRPTVSSVCAAAAAPQTTALRYLAALEQCGLIIRTDAADDQRIRYVELTPDTAVAMRKLLRIR